MTFVTLPLLLTYLYLIIYFISHLLITLKNLINMYIILCLDYKIFKLYSLADKKKTNNKKQKKSLN